MDKELDLTTKDGVIELMQSSKDVVEWNANCDKVKKANEGYPTFWFTEVVLSGVMAETKSNWS